jgi:hypothetical protein
MDSILCIIIASLLSGGCIISGICFICECCPQKQNSIRPLSPSPPDYIVINAPYAQPPLYQDVLPPPKYEPIYEPNYEPNYEPIYEPNYEPNYEPIYEK